MTDTADRPDDTGTRLQRRLVELPAPVLAPRTVVVQCAGCQGHGKVRMSVHDVLTESIGLIADQADGVVIMFYERLYAIDPALAELFPPDLLTAPAHAEGSRGAAQRDKLVEVLVKVATLYGAGEREEVELVTILRRAGASHASFLRRSEGVIRGATPAEYESVRRALFDTLHAVGGDRWRPEYDAAWDQAYTFASREMQHAQEHEGREMQHPRQPRATADPPKRS